jgi:hypothetical protein
MTQKITIPRDKRQDAIDAQNAARQSASNPYVMGVDAVMEEGIGSAIKSSQNKYAPNIALGDLIQGSGSNFSAKDAPGNAPLDDNIHQTGSVQYQTSSTEEPQAAPEDLEASKVDRRLNMIRRAAGNAEDNLNGPTRGM